MTQQIYTTQDWIHELSNKIISSVVTFFVLCMLTFVSIHAMGLQNTPAFQDFLPTFLQLVGFGFVWACVCRISYKFTNSGFIFMFFSSIPICSLGLLGRNLFAGEDGPDGIRKFMFCTDPAFFQTNHFWSGTVCCIAMLYFWYKIGKPYKLLE